MQIRLAVVGRYVERAAADADDACLGFCWNGGC